MRQLVIVVLILCAFTALARAEEEFIILTAEQAAAVRGPSGPHSALNPVPLANGSTYVLPADVLTDPAHASRRETLEALPRRAVTPEEWPGGDDE